MQKSDHNVIATELKYIWNKYITHEKFKVTSKLHAIYKFIYHSGSYSLLIGKRRK